MVFSSSIFLFLFLPVFLACYYATPSKWRSLTIVLGSYSFYAWWRLDFTGLFLFVTAWNYLFSRLIVHAHELKTSKHTKQYTAIGIIGNLVVLAFFKYFNFGVDSLNALITSMGGQPVSTLHVILPIGISFYIFQSISFLVDIYRKDAPVPKHFLDFAAFISLFPQLIAGPVLRYKDLAHQFEKRTHSFEKFSQGTQRFMLGFCQKVLIADHVAPIADQAFALSNPSAMDAWLGVTAYTIQLFFDFSGYSHMAIGLGLMMGFKFIENFDHPYISRSITEFWRRWHISLSTWLKDYLYIPLGGNRCSKVRTYLNLFLTMVLGGLWHGANWTFVIWGAWHGAILALERYFNIASKVDQKRLITQTLHMVLTLTLVMVGWVFFRAENINHALAMLEAMFIQQDWSISDQFAWQLSGIATLFLGIGWCLVFIVPPLERTKKIRFRVQHHISMQVLTIIFFVIAVTKLVADTHSPFLYFQF